MASIRSWLHDGLGISPVLQDVLLLPLFACAFLWVLSRAILWIVRSRTGDRASTREWDRASTIVTVLLGVGLFSSIWLAAVHHLADLAGSWKQEEIERTQAVLAGSLYSLLATAAMALLYRMLTRVSQVTSERVRRWAQAGSGLRLQKLELISRKKLGDAELALIRFTRIGTTALLLYAYVSLVLSFFPFTAPVSDRILFYVVQPAAAIGRAAIAYLPNLIYLVVLVVVARYLLKVVRWLFSAIGRGELVFRSFEADWADPTYKLARALLIVFTLMVAFPYLPAAESEFFKGFSVFVGAIVTLGSTGAIGNAVAGIILTYTGSFRIGDRVRIGDITGDVVVKTLFVTRLRTVENEEVTLPNSTILGDPVVNYSAAAKNGELVVRIRVGIGYDVPHRKVEELLKAAARSTPGIRADPEPVVWAERLGDFGVVYQLRACTALAEQMAGLAAALRRNTLDAFHDAGLEVMTPDVHAVRNAGPEAVPQSARKPGAFRIEAASLPRGSSGGPETPPGPGA